MSGYSDHVWSREPSKLKMADLDNCVLLAFLSFIEAIASFLLHK